MLIRMNYVTPIIFRLLFIQMLFLMQIRVFSQEPFAYTLNDENGLPSNEVYRVTQDNEGYIWIGCDAGLFRYDGLNFIPFSNPKQNSRGISGLVFDHENRLWCHNFSGQLFRVERTIIQS